MPASSTARYAWEPLVDFATAAFERAGLSGGDARITATSLVMADLRGVMTHGMVRLPIYVRNAKDGTLDPTAQPEVMQESGGTALLDGQNAMGQVVSTRAMELAIEKARKGGVGAVTVRNSNHFGTCAHWAIMAAERGMIGIAMTNGSAAMAPTGGLEMLVGNNPLAIAAPSNEAFPIVLDMALTVVARGKIRLAQMNGQQIPLGWGLDKDGKPTEDPASALTGSLLPVGGYKGYGMAVMVDMLTAVLSGAALSPELENMGFTLNAADENLKKGPVEPGVGTGHFFLALDIKQFLPLAAFKERASGYAAMLHEAPRAAGVDRIYLPGEIEYLTETDRRANGIAYEDSLVREWQKLGEAEGLMVPEPLSI
jgi:LDH2 family malate/lactate/ureidoglycolate dehydrogenase